jgi:hypothetical protein
MPRIFFFRGQMSLKQRLWDAGYAMAEPFIRMPQSNKLVFALALPELLFMVMAARLGVDGRIIIGTVFGSMFAVAGYTLRSSRP